MTVVPPLSLPDICMYIFLPVPKLTVPLSIYVPEEADKNYRKILNLLSSVASSNFHQIATPNIVVGFNLHFLALAPGHDPILFTYITIGL